MAWGGDGVEVMPKATEGKVEKASDTRDCPARERCSQAEERTCCLLCVDGTPRWGVFKNTVELADPRDNIHPFLCSSSHLNSFRSSMKLVP